MTRRTVLLAIGKSQEQTTLAEGVQTFANGVGLTEISVAEGTGETFRHGAEGHIDGATSEHRAGRLGLLC